MKIINKMFEIKNTNALPPCLEFIESFFKERALVPVRWAIVDTDENSYTLNAAVIED